MLEAHVDVRCTRLSHSLGLRRSPHRNARSAAQYRPAPTIVRCCVSAHAPISPKNSRLSRMTSGVTALLSLLKAFFSEMDRLSVDPELMIRMLIVGYSNFITLKHHAEKWVAVPGNKRCEYKEIQQPIPFRNRVRCCGLSQLVYRSRSACSGGRRCTRLGERIIGRHLLQVASEQDAYRNRANTPGREIKKPACSLAPWTPISLCHGRLIGLEFVALTRHGLGKLMLNRAISKRGGRCVETASGDRAGSKITRRRANTTPHSDRFSYVR
jgi:hypothetical protein